MTDTGSGAAETRAPEILRPFHLTEDGHYRLAQLVSAMRSVAMMCEPRINGLGLDVDIQTLAPILHVLADTGEAILEDSEFDELDAAHAAIRDKLADAGGQA